MNTKNKILVTLLLIGLFANAQNKKQNSLVGSWMGRTITKDAASSELVLFRFEFKNNSIKGFMDFPNKRLKDVSLDKVWKINDSVFADARKSLGWPESAPLIFKGGVIRGDSIIDDKKTAKYN